MYGDGVGLLAATHGFAALATRCLLSVSFISLRAVAYLLAIAGRRLWALPRCLIGLSGRRRRRRMAQRRAARPCTWRMRSF